MGSIAEYAESIHAYVHTAFVCLFVCLLCVCVIVCGENSVGTNPRKRAKPSPPPSLPSKQQQSSNSGKATPYSSASDANGRSISSTPNLHGNSFHDNGLHGDGTTPHSDEGVGKEERYLEHPAYTITMEEEEETITRIEVVEIDLVGRRCFDVSMA